MSDATKPLYQRLHEPAQWYRGFANHLLAVPEGKPLRVMFPVPKDGKDGLDRHNYLMSRAVVNPPMEHAVADAIGRYARDGLGVAMHDQTPETEAIGDEIADRGWSMLPPFDADSVERIMGDLADLPVHAKSGASRSKALDLEEARAFNVATYKPESILRVPSVLSFATEPAALAAAERYLGAPPVLIALEAWWSFPGHEAKEAQRFHLDIDDHRFMKHFLYLTDVDEESGPHAYVEHTHRPQDYGDIIARGHGETEQKAIFDWLFQTLRKEDADVEHHTGKRPTLITGDAGTRFLAVTRGLHKGLAPTKKPRLVLQATYGISPSSAKRKADIPASTLPEEATAPPNDYLLWLFVDRSR